MDSVSRQLRKITVSDSKFMANFDPIKSKREQMKKKKYANRATNAKKTHKYVDIKKTVKDIYDNKGVHIASGLDMCDCLDTNCEGCFYACRKCKSEKCGLECRNRRKHYYKAIEDQIVESKRVNTVAIAHDEELAPILVR